MLCDVRYYVLLAVLVPIFYICSAAAFVVAGERAKDEDILPATLKR